MVAFPAAMHRRILCDISDCLYFLTLLKLKVHSRWIFSAKLLSRCKPAPPFLVIFTLSCFIRDRAIESDLTSLILTCEIKSQIF
jgi:hypothetical protein